MMFEIVALLVGVLLVGGGLYYLTAEKSDHEARKIYKITLVAGVIIAAAAAAKLFL